MVKAINDTIAINNKKDGYIRPHRDARRRGRSGLDPRKCADPQVIVIVDDISLYPAELTKPAWRSPRFRRSAITPTQ